VKTLQNDRVAQDYCKSTVPSRQNARGEYSDDGDDGGVSLHEEDGTEAEGNLDQHRHHLPAVM